MKQSYTRGKSANTSSNQLPKNLIKTIKQIKATTKTKNEQNQTSKQNLEFELLYFLVGTIFLLDLYTCTDTKKCVGGGGGVRVLFSGGFNAWFFCVFFFVILQCEFNHLNFPGTGG